MLDFIVSGNNGEFVEFILNKHLFASFSILLTTFANIDDKFAWIAWFA